jgi:LPXTG-site transpeptidase (sortase) family protein
MKKATKFTLVSLFVFSCLSFFLGYRLSVVDAYDNDNQPSCTWGSWTDTSTCATNTCGTSIGTKNQSKTCENKICDYSCPSVSFTWQTEEIIRGHYENCPTDYTVDPHHEDKCEKDFSAVYAIRYSDKIKGKCPSSDSLYTSTSVKECSKNVKISDAYTDTIDHVWVKETKKTVDHSVNVIYDKSNDPHKCHRPSDSDLSSVYGMTDNKVRNDFKYANFEWKDSHETNCHQQIVDTHSQTVSCNNAPITECERPVDCVWHWSNCSATCGGGIKTIVVDTPAQFGGKSCPSESESCNTDSCPPEPSISPEITPEVSDSPTLTPTPTSGSNNNGGDNGDPSDPGPQVCNDADPGAPSNLRATALGGGQVRLDWDNAFGPHTSYAVAYGPSIGNYLYGDPNVGNVTSYTVKALNPGGKYCFYVQAQNGCKGGVPSNVVCSNQGTGSLRILGVSDNYNPLVDGIRESYGGDILGASTELAGTGEVIYSTDKLPSGNVLDSTQTISIPSINLSQPIYLPKKIGDLLTVGHNEVLRDGNLYYGHNGFGIFSSLYKLNIGDKVITTENNVVRQYQIVQKLFVDKSDVDAIKTDADQISLMTCSVTYPDSRIIVKASLIK